MDQVPEKTYNRYYVDIGDLNGEEAASLLENIKNEIDHRPIPSDESLILDAIFKSVSIPAYCDPSSLSAEEIAESNRMWAEEEKFRKGEV